MTRPKVRMREARGGYTAAELATLSKLRAERRKVVRRFRGEVRGRLLYLGTAERLLKQVDGLNRQIDEVTMRAGKRALGV